MDHPCNAVEELGSEQLESQDQRSTRSGSPVALWTVGLGVGVADSAQSQRSLATIPSFVGPNRGGSLVCSRSRSRPPVHGYLAPCAAPTRHVHERARQHTAARTTVTGQGACWTTCWLTEPSSRLANPQRHRHPTTRRVASCASPRRMLAGWPSSAWPSQGTEGASSPARAIAWRTIAWACSR